MYKRQVLDADADLLLLGLLLDPGGPARLLPLLQEPPVPGRGGAAGAALLHLQVFLVGVRVAGFLLVRNVRVLDRLAAPVLGGGRPSPSIVLLALFRRGGLGLSLVAAKKS